MSSILKALKRLEEEKADRLESPVDIARDILRHRRQPRRALPGGLLGLVGGAVLLGAGFLALYTWRSAAAPPKAAAPVVVAQSPSAPTTVPETSGTLPRSAALVEPEIVEVRMAPAAPAAPSTPLPRSTESQTKSPPLPKVGTPPAKSGPQKTVKAPILPKLAVSGIAFQPEREARLAIVNDLPVMEGTAIEGAEVEEIMEDRVRFRFSGHSFEVRLGRSD